MAMTGDATIIGLFFGGIFTGKHRKPPYLMVDTMVGFHLKPIQYQDDIDFIILS